jgi:hypothetical protein
MSNSRWSTLGVRLTMARVHRALGREAVHERCAAPAPESIIAREGVWREVNPSEIPACRRKREAGARGDELRELRSDDLESEPLRDRYRRLRVVRLLGWLGRLRGRHAALLELPLEAARRDDYECARAFGLDLEGVRHSAGTPHPGAGAGDELVIALAEADLALEARSLGSCPQGKVGAPETCYAQR